MMEDETGYLSHDATDRDSDPAPRRTARLQPLLASILHDLNARRVSTAVVGATTIYLKIVSHPADPPPVADHLVPLLHAEYRGLPADRWDLTTQQMLPFIDGVNHIARIAAESDVEPALVKACVQNLVYYGVVQMLPLLKYSNVYMCTRSLQRLTKEPQFGAACRRFVALEVKGGGCGGVDEEKTEQTEGGGGRQEKQQRRPPSLQKILLMYSYMTHGVNLRTLCQRTQPRENGIDEK